MPDVVALLTAQVTGQQLIEEAKKNRKPPKARLLRHAGRVFGFKRLCHQVHSASSTVSIQTPSCPNTPEGSAH